MANITIYTHNLQLTGQCNHALIGKHSLHRITNTSNELNTDIILIDAKKIDEDVELLNIFTRKNTPFLVIGSNWSEQNQIGILTRGASGYCDESDVSVFLNRAIDSILSGDIWIRRALVPKVIAALSRHQESKSLAITTESSEILLKQIESLSTRENEVANMIRQGENNKRIALALNISERTVKAHLSSIFRKLEVDDRLRLAIRLKELEQNSTNI